MNNHHYFEGEEGIDEDDHLGNEIDEAQGHDDLDGPSSDYAGSIYSDLTSIKSDFFSWEYENGRRYQGLIANRYGLPNDEPEQNREGLKHRLLSDYVLEGRHFMAPIDRFPQKIVDLGCGAGFWTLDVAEEYPGARVIGCDISPIQPRWLPNNVEFHIEDLDDELSPWSVVYQEADLIFLRCVLQTVRHSQLLLRRAYENLKPGGWIECHEIVLPVTWEDGKPALDHPFTQLYDHMDQGPFAKVYGWEIFFPTRLPSALREAGFINMSEKHTNVPIGKWHADKRMREMGLINHCVLGDWVPAVMNKEKALGVNEEEADAFAAEILNAFENPDYHAQVDWASFWAQKPL